MKRLSKKELFSIPNLMGYFRIILIPFFCYYYIKSIGAGRGMDYWTAVVILAVSTITDFLDGKVARYFNMVTELGKALDPVADKLTHGAVAICVAVEYPFMWFLLLIMLIKEGYMLVMNGKAIKQGKYLGSARWFGKLCTGSLFVTLILLIIWREMSIILANVLIIINICIMIFTWLQYQKVFRELLKQ